MDRWREGGFNSDYQSILPCTQWVLKNVWLDLPGGAVDKNPPAKAGDMVLFSPPGDLPDPGIEPTSLNLLHWQAGSLPLVPPGKPLQRSKWAEMLRVKGDSSC